MREPDEIKVSVIIYVKDTADYIEECVRSVMNQTIREIEILIVDGGSTDGTLDIVEKIEKTDHRIRIFHSSPSVGAQFNLGLREARGQYIGVCEADDYLLPEMYEKQYQIAEENQLDVLRAGYYQVFHIKNKEYRFKLQSCYQEDLKEKVIIPDNDTFFLEQGVNGFWNGIYRRQFLLDNHIWMNETRGASYQDISFSFLTQLCAGRIWFMDEAFYCYRIDNPKASVNSPHGVALHIREYEELRKRLKVSNQWERYKNIFFSWELVSYRWFIRELPDDFKAENTKKVYDYLEAQREEDGFDADKVMETVKGLAKTLGCETEFARNILSGTEDRKALLEYIENMRKCDKETILFGAGHMGNILMRFFELYGKDILLADNSMFLQKRGLMGRTVYSPRHLALRFPQGIYIIASAVHAAEMKDQLLGLGIQEGNILICENEEFFLRKIFAEAGKYSGLR